MEISGYLLVESQVLSNLLTPSAIKEYIEKLKAELPKTEETPEVTTQALEPDVPTPEPTPDTPSSSTNDDIQSKIDKLQSILDKNQDISIKLDRHKLFVEGKRTSNEQKAEYIFSLTGRCLVKTEVPVVDDTDTDGTTTYYDRYALINRAIKMVCNSNLDIEEHDSFDLVIYELDITFPLPANCLKGMTLVNLIDVSDIQYGAIKEVIDTGLEEVKKIKLPEIDWEKIFKRQDKDYADVYLEPTFSVITNGKIDTEEELSTTGVKTKKYVWKGDYPLDRLIYAVQSNLDILLLNNKIKGDIYGNLYATLMAQAMSSSTVIEQTRIQAYEQASQFQIRTRVDYYLGVITAKLNVIKALAEVQTQFLQKSLIQAQIKLYNIQAKGFTANSINKVFNAQLEGASTAFSSGMLDTPPAAYNNPDLMSSMSDVGTNLSVL